MRALSLQLEAKIFWSTKEFPSCKWWICESEISRDDNVQRKYKHKTISDNKRQLLATAAGNTLPVDASHHYFFGIGILKKTGVLFCQCHNAYLVYLPIAIFLKIMW